MREALGLAPKYSTRPQGNRLDKHEFSELVKRSSTAEDLGAGHAEAAWVHGLGFSSREPRPWEDPSSLKTSMDEEVSTEVEKVKEPADPSPSAAQRTEKESDNENDRKKRRREDKGREKHERREKRYSRDSDDRRKHKKEKKT